MSVAESNGECCRVPTCGRAPVGYLLVGNHGRREVYVGRPGALNHFPLCAEHLYAAGTTSAPRTQQQRLRVS
jgi:hypothetical protein